MLHTKSVRTSCIHRYAFMRWCTSRLMRHPFRPGRITAATCGRFATAQNTDVSGRVVDQIEDTLVKPGPPNFAETPEAMDNWSAAQTHDAAEQAIGRMPPTIVAEELGKSSLDQCAIYNPESGDWHFVDFE